MLSRVGWLAVHMSKRKREHGAVLSTEAERRSSGLAGDTDRKRIKVATQTGLARLAVDARTRKRYDMALATLIEFCIVVKNFILVKVLSSSYISLNQCSVVDLHLSAYFQKMSEVDPDDPADDDPPVYRHWEASHCHMALTDKFPELRKHLPRSVRNLSAWGRQQHVDRAPPLPLGFCQAMVGWAWERGARSFAVCLLLCFRAMLRPSELFNLRVANLNLHGSRVGGVSIGLNFQTKTSVKKRAAESVFVTDPSLIKLLDVVFGKRPPDELLIKEVLFRDIFQKACDTFSFSVVAIFRLYSLRRGGASQHFRDTKSMDSLCQAGRWQSAKSAQVYIRDALAAELEGNYLSMNEYKKKYHTYLTCFRKLVM